jgi:uncharacterized protein (TIGR00251 family)
VLALEWEASGFIGPIGIHRNSITRRRAIFIKIKVKPNARISALLQADDGTWLAQLKAPPVDGKANDELIALVARRFECLKSSVSIKSGAGARMKLVKIEE